MSFKNSIAVNSAIQDPTLRLSQPNAKQLVWDYLKINMGSSNSILALQTKIAKEIGMNRETVCNAIKELEKKGFIAKDGKEGTTNRYFLNPHFVWKGEAKDHRIAIAKWDKIQQRKAEDEKENTNF